jgi:hypothetical protein
MPPLSLCLNEFDRTCSGGQTHTQDTGIDFIFANVVFLGMSFKTYCREMIHKKNAVRERVKYWCVSCQIFLEICRISEKDWQLSPRFSNFSLFWVSGPPRNAAQGVNTYRICVESPRMIDNLFRGSTRMFFNNISVSLVQLSILLRDSTNLWEGLVWNASIFKITVKNRRTLFKI